MRMTAVVTTMTMRMLTSRWKLIGSSSLGCMRIAVLFRAATESE